MSRPDGPPRDVLLLGLLPCPPDEAVRRLHTLDPTSRLLGRRGALGARRVTAARAPEDGPHAMSAAVTLRVGAHLRFDWLVAPQREGAEVRLHVQAQGPRGADRLLELGGRRWLRDRFTAVLEALGADLPGAGLRGADVVLVRRGGRLLALRQLRGIVDLFATAFAEPPFCEGPQEVAAFRERIRWRARQAGFTILTAQSHTDEVVGFVVGRATDTADPELAQLVAAIPAESLEAWGSDRRVLFFNELAVHPRHRGRRLSRRLAEAADTARDEPHGLLLVQPAAQMQRAFYERLGWRRVGSCTPAPGVPAHDVMVRDYASERRAKETGDHRAASTRSAARG